MANNDAEIARLRAQIEEAKRELAALEAQEDEWQPSYTEEEWEASARHWGEDDWMGSGC